MNQSASSRVAAGRAIALAAATLPPLACLAQASPDILLATHDAPARQLGVVTITGQRATSLPSQIPSTTESVTGREVETRINAIDSEDALKYLPSLLVRKRYAGDYNHAVLSTRASGTGNSARSLVYADGILLSSLLGNGAAFTPRWGLVTPEEIERVDVLYGPFSAAYPGNSVGAVVDYQTRMPSKFEAHVKFGAFAQPFDLYRTQATYRGSQASASLGDRRGSFAWWVNVNRLDSEGQPLSFATRTVANGTAASAGTRVTGAVRAQDRTGADWFILGTSGQMHTVQDHAKLKFAHDITPAVRAAYTVGLWQNRSEGRAESYLRDVSGQPVYSGPVNIHGLDYTGTSGGKAGLVAGDLPSTRERLEHAMQALSLKRHAGGVFDWEVAVSGYRYGRDRLRTATTALPGAAEGGAGRITDQDGTGWDTLAARATWRPNPSHAVDIGLQRDSHRLRSQVWNTSDWIAGEPGSFHGRFEGNTRLESVFVQDAWRLSERWKAVLGLRWERWSASKGLTQSAYAGTASQGGCDAATARCTLVHGARAERFASPKVAVAYQLRPVWVLKASTGRAIRFPTVSELYQGGVNASGQAVNNDPDLRPERSWTTELSSEWNVDAGQFRFTLFHEATRDGLFSQLNTATNANTVQNVERLRTGGVEAALQMEHVFVRGLDIAASATYADSKILANAGRVAVAGDTVGKRQPRVPDWRATVLLSYQATERLTASFGARYSGRQYGTLDNTDHNGFAFQGSSKFFTTDLRLRLKLNGGWSVALGVDNLNNCQYWNFHPYPQRTYNAEVKFDH